MTKVPPNSEYRKHFDGYDNHNLFIVRSRGVIPMSVNKTTAWIRGHEDGAASKPINPKRYGSTKGTSTQLQEIDYKIGYEAGASRAEGKAK